MFGLEDELQDKIKELEAKILDFKNLLIKIRKQDESFYSENKNFSVKEVIEDKKNVRKII